MPAVAESIYHGLDPALMAAALETVRAHVEKLKTEGLVFNDDESHRWMTVRLKPDTTYVLHVVRFVRRTFCT